MILTIIIAFISIIALVILHEFGHFILAKRFGVRVEEFGIGYPPRILGKKFGETIYSLNLLPFGAFVRIYGEQEEIRDPASFSEKKAWQRALIILGGVISFWIVAVVLLSIVMGLGVPSVIEDDDSKGFSNPKVQIVAVSQDSPAYESGIKTGDTLFGVKNSQVQIQNINKVGEFQGFIEENKGKEIILTIQRGSEFFDVNIIPRASPPQGEGPLGVGLARTALRHYPWYQAPIEGVKATVNLTWAIIEGLATALINAIKGQPTGAQVVGPVGILSLFVQVSKLGINYYLQFIAVISVHLALVNLFPIPVTDGGKLVFLAIEKIRRKAINKNFEKNLDLVFFALLIALMIWVTIKDIIRIF